MGPVTPVAAHRLWTLLKGELATVVKRTITMRNTLALAVAVAVFGILDSASASAKYSDGRPEATLRMEARDQGVVLKHGDGPRQCDMLGACEALIFKEHGTYHLLTTAPDRRVGWPVWPRAAT